ncbi:TetR/AcrR family transcriptional regulator [Leptospira langatensis]|uniref:TetR/AcrR family transcriptional regulator n=1 Tax=Leptospira langatensis TaxID=2484983 RepID=A0A5F1ZWN8_9LEPT|nr:TetR/AcrR family transcriptional regulator [Leptospira langatensis]TGJ98302.1 TetR/AcrR family transcriptional regulator [Leptospira langatensis]TGL43216.1 TetR/AcrR family transcriptional regulator [Leptospira langatensis]
MPKTGLKPEELQEKVLDAAEMEIRRNGVERLKLTDVARTLNVSHAALYKHFADKEALLDSISKRWLDRIDTALEEVTSRPGSLEQKIEDWFLTLHKMKREKVQSDPRIFTAFNMSAEKTRPFVQKHLQSMHDQLQKIVGEGIKEGLFFCNTPLEGAKILFDGTLAFHHPRIVFERISEDRIDLLKAVVRALISGLKEKKN